MSSPGYSRDFQTFFTAPLAAVPEAFKAIGVGAAFGDKAGIDNEGLLMVGRHHLGNRCFVECDKVKRASIPPRKRTFVIGTVAAEITKRGVAGKHQHKPQQMGNELSLRFLGLGQGRKYTLKQSHGAPPFSVALANTTLELEGSCGYLFVKTVRSIVGKRDCQIQVVSHQDTKKEPPANCGGPFCTDRASTGLGEGITTQMETVRHNR